jgi:hypothetical protein
MKGFLFYKERFSLTGGKKQNVYSYVSKRLHRIPLKFPSFF